MTDADHAERIRDAAKILAVAMNEAAETGLWVDVELRPHSNVSQGTVLIKRGGYIPIISVSRTLRF